MVILIVACAVRLFRLSKPNSVVFDEVHFGKFASRYIKTQYFVDVHPPLAKLLITMMAFIFGYDGQFDFKDIGKVYEGVPYVAMRMLPATLGVATIPLSYLTMRALDCRATTALLATVFVTFENGLITQSRHILLDSPLLFFTALTIFAWCGFCNEDKREPFTEGWWAWLTLTGLSLGAVVSCKWVGLFTIATVGVSTLKQLWLLLGDLRVSSKLWMRHFMARALCLILIPVIFYMVMFELHFLILENSGEGDGFMSSEFQHTLGGRSMSDTFADVALGSKVTVRHVNTQGGYLHSHPHVYPAGSGQQQITLYPHRDENNEWLIINGTEEGHPETDWMDEPLTYITHNMRVKLRHVSTDKCLHSHDYRPPVSDVDFQNEVSGYGVPGYTGDVNDHWIVEIEKGDKRDRESWKRMRTLRTHFRLRHEFTGCYLFSHKVKLPDWGFEQQEVTCNKNAVRANSLWYVETATNIKLPSDAPRVNYKLPGFFGKFMELQQVMWTTNAGLTDRHIYDSRPVSWPTLRRGINFWVSDHRQIYLIGNPIIWWLSTAAVIAYVAVRGILTLRAKRGYRDFDDSRVVRYDSLCGFLFVAWFLHYAPFFLMARQLFLHHYFPALYFSILLFCSVFDMFTSGLRPRIRLQIAAVLMIMAIWSFSYFSPLAYGNMWTQQSCTNAQWLRTWDFSCKDFPTEYSHYGVGGVVMTKHGEAVVTVGGEEGGRGAIVVDDKLGEESGHLPGDSETQVPVGKVEPGRDIFAPGIVKEVKSQPQDNLSEEGVEKVISTIVVTGQNDLSTTETPTAHDDSSTQTTMDSLTEAAQDDKRTDPASTDSGEVLREQGPVIEEIAQADRVRAELFHERAEEPVVSESS